MTGTFGPTLIVNVGVARVTFAHRPAASRLPFGGRVRGAGLTPSPSELSPAP